MRLSTKLLLALIPTVALLLQGVRSARAGMGFVEPKPVRTDGLTDAATDFLPDIAGDGTGVWVAVWYSYGGGTWGSDQDILHSRSTDNGATWSPAAPIHSNAITDSGNDFVPRVATDGNGVWIVVWYSRENLTGDMGTDEDIFFVRSTDNGANWSPPAVANSNATNTVFDGLPTIATDRNGLWIMTWSSFDHLDGTTVPRFNILHSRSTDGGATWGAATALTAGVGDDRRSVIATDRDGIWIIIWTSTDDLGGTIGSDWDVLFSRSTNQGVNWSTAVPLNLNAYTDSGSDGELPYGLAPRGPTLATDGLGTWICAWGSNDSLAGTKGTDGDCLFARSTDNGTSWSWPQPLNSNAFTDPQDATGNDFVPHLATDRNGTWLCAWTTSHFSAPLHSDYDIAISRSIDGGLNWTPISTLNSYAGTDFEARDEVPNVASDEAGTWAVIWDADESFFSGGDHDPLVALSATSADPPDPPLGASDQEFLKVMVDVILGKKVLDLNGDGVVDIADVVALSVKQAKSH